MDFHILIIIACVFLASVFSLLVINKLFRRKTFEDIIAEKKALNEKIYARNKKELKKPKQKQQMKKELKREKKQRQKESLKEQDGLAGFQQDDEEGEQLLEGLSKVHVEFEPEPVVVTYTEEEAALKLEAPIEGDSSPVSMANTQKGKSKKVKKQPAGILLNKNEPVAVKDSPTVEQVNQFELKVPKDVVELKKQEKEKKDERGNKKDKQSKKDKNVAATEKPNEKKSSEKPNDITPATAASAGSAVEAAIVMTKELKQQEEKVRQGSPKIQHNNNNTNNNNNNKKQQNKKQTKETTATKELVLAVEKLSDADSIGYSLLMNLFRRAELNRSEIQLLIDYLLNKQQDMPSLHSEWSDDVNQKLKRQLEEKERAFNEAQEASLGLQAKLRELRAEINSERIQMQASVKAYIEKLHNKDLEISNFHQELQSMQEKLGAERQKYQILQAKHQQQQQQAQQQAPPQDLVNQMQMMQNELNHKEKCIAELTHVMNASRQAMEELQQKDDIIQDQARQIHALTQQRNELEQISNNRVFELEKLKTLETENGERQVEIRNLQNALESARADLAQARQDAELMHKELTQLRNAELGEKQELGIMRKVNDELKQQLGNRAMELANLQAQIADKEKTLQEMKVQQTTLQQRIVAAESNVKQESTKLIESMQADALKKEHELRQHLIEQAAKNNNALDTLKSQLAQKDKQLLDLQAKIEDLLQKLAPDGGQQQEELQRLVAELKSEVASKQQQFLEVEQKVHKMEKKEKDLMQQLQEQREKNNDLRMKNWKLIEALQNAEQRNKQNNMLTTSANATLVHQQQPSAAASAQPSRSTSSAKEQQQMRELLQRLYPEAVKACSGAALGATFEQWLEQVIAMHVKQNSSMSSNSTSSSNKSTQATNSDSSEAAAAANHHTLNGSGSARRSTDSRSSHSNEDSGGGGDGAYKAEMEKLRAENASFRIKIDELTKLVTKTSNTLSHLEGRAREQDEYWRSIVRSKDDIISSLQHSNGVEDA